RHWLAGGNPYLEQFGDPMHIPYNYAPIVLLIFAWTNWVDLVPAVIAWSAAVGAIIAGAAWFTARQRRGLPVTFAIAASLWCTASVFSMERGNCDALVVLLIMIAVVALRKQSLLAEVIVGVC